MAYYGVVIWLLPGRICLNECNRAAVSPHVPRLSPHSPASPSQCGATMEWNRAAVLGSMKMWSGRVAFCQTTVATPQDKYPSVRQLRPCHGTCVFREVCHGYHRHRTGICRADSYGHTIVLTSVVKTALTPHGHGVIPQMWSA